MISIRYASLARNAIRRSGIPKEIIHQLKKTLRTDLHSADSLPEEVDGWVRRWQKWNQEALPKSLSETVLQPTAVSIP